MRQFIVVNVNVENDDDDDDGTLPNMSSHVPHRTAHSAKDREKYTRHGTNCPVFALSAQQLHRNQYHSTFCTSGKLMDTTGSSETSVSTNQAIHLSARWLYRLSPADGPVSVSNSGQMALLSHSHFSNQPANDVVQPETLTASSSTKVLR